MKIKLILLIFTLFTGCAGTEIILQGINVTDLRNVDPVEAIAGAAMSLIIHEAGHAIYSKFRGHDWQLNLAVTGPEIEFWPDNNSDIRWSARSGFLLQNLVGFVLTAKAADSDFTKGYTAFSAFEAFSYPLRRQDSGDLYNLNLGNNQGDLEFGVYAAFSLFNLHRSLDN